MYKSLFFCVIFSIFTATLYAQHTVSDNTKFSISAGYEHVRTLDLNASPLLYAANNGKLGIGYEKRNENGLWKAGCTVSLGSNQSQRHGVRNAAYPNKPDIFGESDTTFYELNPGLSFLSWSLDFSRYWNLGSKSSLLGLGLSNKHFYGAIGADTWFFNHLDIKPAYRQEFSISESFQLSFELATTLLAYIVRQPYTLDPSLPLNSYLNANVRTGSSLATVNSFQNFEFSSALRRSMSNGNDVGITYQFAWLNHKRNEGRNLGMYSNSLALSYNF